MSIPEVDRSIKTATCSEPTSKIKQEVAEGYDRATREVEEAGLKRLLLRIRDHEVYHTEVFSNLLKKEEQQG